VDAPDLAPATRKRTRPAPAATPPAATGDEDARLAALESAVRAIDVRIELLEREVREGFQEVASRALVMAEATDEALARIEAALAARQPETGGLEAAMKALADGLITPVEATVAATIDLKTAVASLAERLEEDDAVRSQLDLIAERLSTLLGGPSLTELMDRIDEVDEHIAAQPVGESRRRRRGEPL
jgi:hypothetical protein